MNNTHARRIALTCIKDAKGLLGSGWNHVSKEIQWGLVCTHILAVCLGQDETVPDANVRRMMIAVEAEARKVIFP
jgi:hypothetical protein